MKLKRILSILIVLLTLQAVAERSDAAGDLADDFASQVNLEPLQTLSVQHQQTIKTLDSFARQVLGTITGKSTLGGRSALYTVLDISFRREDYLNGNLIKIKNVPLRNDLRRLDHINEAEKDRIVREGTVSLAFWMSPDVQRLKNELEASAVHKASAIQQADGAAFTLFNLGAGDFPLLRVIAPATTRDDDHVWHNIGEVNEWAKAANANPAQVPAALTDYGDRIRLLGDAGNALLALRDAWRQRDAAAVNKQAAVLAELLPRVNPEVYPSPFMRKVELVYNRLAKLTIPGAAIYFAAFVCFLMSARSGVNSLRLWGLRLLVLGFAVHTVGIGVRWWLVAAQHGNWFDGIPIKNMFESVLMSAWFGAAVGLALEIWRSRGFFGAAASFVGWMSLIAIFSVPYVFNKEIGGEIGQVNGILMSYWLYIHVTLVVASYALIGMGFLLSIWWLVRYYRDYGTLSRQPARQLSSDAASFEPIPSSGGAVSLGFGRTLAMMLFMPTRGTGFQFASANLPEARPVQSAQHGQDARATGQASPNSFLATLDLCNLVVLQLAFWVLGAGVVCGAIWADQSWGRPWGWDPKETFALVTWIVYLIVVHVRVATDNKAWWTAVLSIVGFFVMLFNWIGVNFFLVGLHSYA